MVQKLINPKAAATDPSQEYVPERQVLSRSFDAVLRGIRVLPDNERTWAFQEAMLIELGRIRFGIQMLLAADVRTDDIDLEKEVRSL